MHSSIFLDLLLSKHSKILVPEVVKVNLISLNSSKFLIVLSRPTRSTVTVSKKGSFRAQYLVVEKAMVNERVALVKPPVGKLKLCVIP